MQCGEPKLLKNWKDCELSTKGFEGLRLQQLYRNVSLSRLFFYVLNFKNIFFILANETPLIDANGDGIGQYNIFQLNKRGIYKNVGSWLAGNKLNIDIEKIRKGLQVNKIITKIFVFNYYFYS